MVYSADFRSFSGLAVLAVGASLENMCEEVSALPGTLASFLPSLFITQILLHSRLPVTERMKYNRIRKIKYKEYQN